ncbi:hypothetical protein HDU96_005976 [Phlyctochytrium bullatum]|nr:hypothetical protein HDU96_005976 [Phlyctochytrium bullatum]
MPLSDRVPHHDAVNRKPNPFHHHDDLLSGRSSKTSKEVRGSHDYHLPNLNREDSELLDLPTPQPRSRPNAAGSTRNRPLSAQLPKDFVVKDDGHKRRGSDAPNGSRQAGGAMSPSAHYGGVGVHTSGNAHSPHMRLTKPSGKDGGMIKSNSFDHYFDHHLSPTSQGLTLTSAGLNSFNPSSTTTPRTQTPSLSRRGSKSRRGGAGGASDMIKTRSYDIDEPVAPGVAVHVVGPRSILQKELDILNAVTRRLNEADVSRTASSAKGSSVEVCSRSSMSHGSTRTSNDGFLDRHVHSRRNSGELVMGKADSRSKNPSRISTGRPAGSSLKQDITDSNDDPKSPRTPKTPKTPERSHSKSGGIKGFMESMFNPKRRSSSKHKHGKDMDDDGHHRHRRDKDGRSDGKGGRLMPAKGEMGSLSAPDFPASRPKYNLQDFELREQIGKGAFARVHLVRFRSGRHHGPGHSGPFQKNPTRIYAMKSLRKPDIVATKQVKHVLSEKNLLEMIKYPFVVELLATFQDPRHLYLVMEYVSGGDMFTHLRKNRRFSETVAKYYTVELVLAMEHIHSKGIIYRDLKPENILLDRSGHIKIADFGFARALKSDDKALTFCGTPAYMAPEIILKIGYDKAVDWWSLGIVSYELQAGYSPFYAETPLQIYEKIIDGNMRWSSQITNAHRDLLRRLLEMDPTARMGAEGADEVKRHPWFKHVDWRAHAELRVPSPYVPDVSDDEDVSNFDVYADANSVVKMHDGTMEKGPEDGLYDDYFRDF